MSFSPVYVVYSMRRAARSRRLSAKSMPKAFAHSLLIDKSGTAGSSMGSPWLFTIQLVELIGRADGRSHKRYAECC